MIALTGVTGALGGLVAQHLADLETVWVVRDPTRVPDLDAGRAQVRVAEFADGDAARAALADVDVLLMVSAAESPDRRQEHRAFIAAAADAGVRHIVYTSFAGAAADATFTLGRDHHDAEAAIAEQGLTHTILRNNFYLDVLPSFAGSDGVLRGPAGDGRVAGVARADVAEVAAAVLRDPAAHANATYQLTGPEALTLDEVAARASAATRRELRYQPETLEEAYASRRAGWPQAQQFELDAWVSTYTAIADGSVAQVSDDVRRLVGREPRRLEDVLPETSAPRSAPVR